MIIKDSSENLKSEESIQQKLNQEIVKSDKNVVFDSGAGSGKTFSLVTSLQYLINKKSNIFLEYNQKIMVITYTNNAADNIKNKVGNSEIVELSTIHLRLWEIIKQFKGELKAVHRNYVEQKLEETREKLTKFDIETFFNNPRFNVKELVNYFVNNDQEYYKLRDLNANNLKYYLKINNYEFDKFRNTTKFKEYVKHSRNARKYDDFLHNYNSKGEVIYDSNSNSSNLIKMRISHDEVIEYAYKLIEKSDILKKVIVEKYPYIFIDEYQDTHLKVIKIFFLLQKFAKANGKLFKVCLFGDKFQNIYGDGIGSRLKDYFNENNSTYIDKPFNRRSTTEIIEFSNQIKKDCESNQISIYEEFSGGNIDLKYIKNRDAILNNKILETIDIISDKWSLNQNEEINVLVLTNRDISRFIGIENVHQIISSTKYYKRNFTQINTELLSNELTKLGDVPRIIYNILLLYYKLKTLNVSADQVIPIRLLNKITFYELIMIVDELKNNLLCNVQTFKDFLSNLFSNELSNDATEVIENFLPNEVKVYDDLINQFSELLDDEESKIEELVSISIEEWERWFDYISDFDRRDNINYYTYHNSKGLEFNNVIIILSKKFGKDKDFFSHFFSKHGQSSIDDKYINARNLLYVAVTRAINNLGIIYTHSDDETADNTITEVLNSMIN